MIDLKQHARDVNAPASNKLVNAILSKAGRAERLYRAPHGYYYWSEGESISWPSIYSYRISDFTVGEVLEEVLYNLQHYTATRG